MGRRTGRKQAEAGHLRGKVWQARRRYDEVERLYRRHLKTNQKSWLNDHYNSFVLKECFGSKELRAIQPLDIERFKSKRLATDTKNETPRAPASVNREYELLSRIFNLAIDMGKADFNPCVRVKKFKLDNERYRYLTPAEESALISKLVDARAHLHSMVIIALGFRSKEARAVELEARPGRLFPKRSDCQ